VTISAAPPASAAAPAAPAPPVGPTRALADSAQRAPVVLTRAESLAIADAIRKRVTARRDSQFAKGERALADSLSRRFEQALSDSLTRIIAALRGGRRIEMRGFDPKEIQQLQEIAKRSAAMPNVPGVGTVPGMAGPSAPPTTVYKIVPPVTPDSSPYPPPKPGVHRVLLGVPRGLSARGELTAVGLAVTDSVRRSIAARPGYDVVDATSLSDPRLLPSRTRMGLARAVNAGAVLTALYFPRPDSSVMLQLQLFDVQRNRVVRVLESRPIDPRDPTRGIGDLISATLAALDDVDWRTTPADSLGRRP
jgi:hypothetical protein